nr:4-hydroxyphenylacetate 3-hydroxylase N-terminal domain-containing protein [Streptomyces sioyaensis]
MGARTAQEYLAGLNDGREVWIGGESVQDVTSHPALRRGASSIGAWLDRQHEAELRDVLTFPSPESGDRVATSFLRPVTQEDLGKRSAAFLEAARWSGGMLGRTPDYLNSSFMALASASEFFTAVNPEFGRNIQAYFRHLRENDVVLTHTLVNPSVNRRLTDQGIPSAQVALQIVRHTDRGIVVRGARLLATLGPLADELVVFPSTSLKDDPSSTRYAFAFAVPCATSGLRFLCRDSYDTGRSVLRRPALRPVRGDGRRRRIRRCRGSLGADFPAGGPVLVQLGAFGDEFTDPHDAPGRLQEHRESRVHGRAAVRDDRRQPA